MVDNIPTAIAASLARLAVMSQIKPTIESPADEIHSALPKNMGEKWKIENREKNRRLERERKDRLVKIITLLQQDLPSCYLDKCKSQLKKNTPTRPRSIISHNALVHTREVKIPQYLILESIHDYITSLRAEIYLHEMTKIKSATKEIRVEQKACQTQNVLLTQQTQTIIETTVNAVQTYNISVKDTGCQAEIVPMSAEIVASVTDSPSKHRSFNIHSLISDNKTSPEKVSAQAEAPSDKNQPASNVHIPRPTLSKRTIEIADGSRSPIQTWQPWGKKQSNQVLKQKTPPAASCTSAAAAADTSKNQHKLFSPANDVSLKGVKRKLNEVAPKPTTTIWEANDLLIPNPGKSTPETVQTYSPKSTDLITASLKRPPGNHRAYHQTTRKEGADSAPSKSKHLQKNIPKTIPLPQQAKLGVVPRARKHSDRFNKHRKNDKNTTGRDLTWSHHQSYSTSETDNHTEQLTITPYSAAKVDTMFNNINYETVSKAHQSSQIFDSSFSINSIIPDLNPIAEILQPDNNFGSQNITCKTLIHFCQVHDIYLSS